MPSLNDANSLAETVGIDTSMSGCALQQEADAFKFPYPTVDNLGFDILYPNSAHQQGSNTFVFSNPSFNGQQPAIPGYQDVNGASMNSVYSGSLAAAGMFLWFHGRFLNHD
jgi:hypothetical protein